MTADEASSHARDVLHFNAHDRREEALDEQQAALDQREAALEVREAALANRGDRERELLLEADRRDASATARDVVANRRDMDATLKRLLSSETADSEVLQVRDEAAQDRTDARGDRSAAKADRVQLTDDEPPPQPG